MEEEKKKLPIKTKIAAWWGVGAGVILLVFGALIGLGLGVFALSILPLAIGGLIILFSLDILKRRKSGWMALVPLLIICFLPVLAYSVFIGISSFWMGFWGKQFLVAVAIFFLAINILAPIVLLIKDRKNFFRIAK